MYIATIRQGHCSEGPWKNTTLWVAGCSIRCKGCFNPELWDRKAGRRVSLRKLVKAVREGLASGDKGVAMVGGEPFGQPLALGLFLLAVRALFPHHLITVYSGYTLENLRQRPKNWLALWMTGYLVDGPFMLSQAEDNLGYRGSHNQRVIDLRRKRKNLGRKIVEADWDHLIVLGKDYLSGPPHLLRKLLPTHSADCGFVEKGSHPEVKFPVNRIMDYAYKKPLPHSKDTRDDALWR